MKAVLKTLLPLIVIIGLTISGCDSTEKPKTKTDSDKTPSELPSLQAVLDARKAEAAKQIPPEMMELFKNATMNLKTQNFASKAIGVGDIAPEFALTNAMGKAVSLSEALKSGPVVLKWYRGGWCPYCNLELAAYREAFPEIKRLGATVFAISPEQPDSSLSTSQKHSLEFEVLSDDGNKVAKEYGLVFKLEEKVAEAYSQFINLEAYNNDNSDELPMPATYVINQNGKVVYSFVDEDYTLRGEPSAVINALKKLKSAY